MFSIYCSAESNSPYTSDHFCNLWLLTLESWKPLRSSTKQQPLPWVFRGLAGFVWVRWYREIRFAKGFEN